MPRFLPPRRLWFVVLVLGITAALGLGLAVHADRSDPPVVVPYDPMPRW